MYSTPRPIIDSQGRIIAVLMGHPKDDEWPQVHQEALRAMQTCASECSHPLWRDEHRRGNYACYSAGVSYGGGQTSPTNLANTKGNAAALDKLMDNKAVRRLAGFASSKCR